MRGIVGRRLVITGLVAALGGLLGAAPALADSSYAEHVRSCRADMGFSGTHNPGVMHQGRSGWDPTHAC